MIAVDDYYPWVLRKLYTFSAGHATAAYLGWLKGYHYIHTAIRDPEIRAVVLAAMAEGQRGLAARYGKKFAGSQADLEKIIARFENAAINDPVARVARDPHRKLGANERLVGAARLAEEAGVFPRQLALATAAALCFRNAESNRPAKAPSQKDLAGVLNQVCGLDTGHGFGKTVASSCEQLAPSYSSGNLLLSLTRPMWSWLS
jgi:mannitol-1-phosphate 5-dehydrogenase